MLEVQNKIEKEYKELNGCFCYHSFQDTIYSVSCAFSEYYTKNENINPIINSFKEKLLPEVSVVETTTLSEKISETETMVTVIFECSRNIALEQMKD